MALGNRRCACARGQGALAEAGKRGGGGGHGRVKRVRVRRGTLSDAEAVRRWLGEHERKLVKAVREGTVIVE